MMIQEIICKKGRNYIAKRGFDRDVVPLRESSDHQHVIVYNKIKKKEAEERKWRLHQTKRGLDYGTIQSVRSTDESATIKRKQDCRQTKKRTLQFQFEWKQPHVLS